MTPPDLPPDELDPETLVSLFHKRCAEDDDALPWERQLIFSDT